MPLQGGDYVNMQGLLFENHTLSTMYTENKITRDVLGIFLQGCFEEKCNLLLSKPLLRAALNLYTAVTHGKWKNDAFVSQRARPKFQRESCVWVGFGVPVWLINNSAKSPSNTHDGRRCGNGAFDWRCALHKLRTKFELFVSAARWIWILGSKTQNNALF
jgi:hypothetical protein